MYPILTLAVYASKCRWTGTNIAYTATELEHHFRLSATQYVITSVEHLDTVQAATKKINAPIEIIVFSDLLTESIHKSADGACSMLAAKENIDKLRGTHGAEMETHGTSFRRLHDLLRDIHPNAMFAGVRDIDVGSVAALMSTSGTTGLPKMASRTHRALVLETLAIEDSNAIKPYEIRRLYCTPIFHGFSAPEMIFNALRLGQKTYFMKRYDDTLFPQKVHEYQITETAAPPPMLLRLFQTPMAREKLQSLRTVFTGGAPLAPELRAKFLSIFHIPPRITQVWGMTEGSWFTTFKFPEDDETGSVGRPIPGCEIKVSDQHTTKLANGLLAGELYIRGPFLMIGYLGDVQATASAFSNDGWLKSGDIGYVQDGKVYLIDRVKDLIKVNGWQVAPAELENALLQSPGVQDAAVIGVGQGIDEHPLAFVVPTNTNATAQSIKDHLSERLTRYKTAKCEIRFTTVIPKSISGKILKKELRKQAAVHE